MTSATDLLPPEESFHLHDAAGVERFRRWQRIDPDLIRRLRYAVLQMHEPIASAVQRIMPEHTTAFLRQFDAELLTIQNEWRSDQDGSRKLLLKGRDGVALECVVMRAHTGRTTVCVSSQAGCRAGCPFCATARMGLRRSLIAAEILEQVRLAAESARAIGWRMRNLVFMGMGEPLDNEAEVHAAIEQLIARSGFGITPRRIMVSTVGIPSAMARFIDRFPGVQMAVSLHSARPALRDRLVPWNRKHTWDELRDAIRYVGQRLAALPKSGPVMIEYILLDGVNDQDEDLEALLEYLQGIWACVNLIPFNPIAPSTPWRPTPRERRDRFARRLRDAGIFTTIRYSMGNDIQAACGQLAVLATTATTDREA